MQHTDDELFFKKMKIKHYIHDNNDNINSKHISLQQLLNYIIR